MHLGMAEPSSPPAQDGYANGAQQDTTTSPSDKKILGLEAEQVKEVFASFVDQARGSPKLMLLVERFKDEFLNKPEHVLSLWQKQPRDENGHVLNYGQFIREVTGITGEKAEGSASAS